MTKTRTQPEPPNLRYLVDKWRIFTVVCFWVVNSVFVFAKIYCATSCQCQENFTEGFQGLLSETGLTGTLFLYFGRSLHINYFHVTVWWPQAYSSSTMRRGSMCKLNFFLQCEIKAVTVAPSVGAGRDMILVGLCSDNLLNFSTSSSTKEH